MRVHKKVSALFVLTGIFIIQSRECNEHLIGGRENNMSKNTVRLRTPYWGKRKINPTKGSPSN